MKKNLKILSLTLFVLTIISCEKSTPINSISNTTIEKSKYEYLPEIERSVVVSKNDKLISEFVSIVKNSSLTIDYSSAIFHKITFKGFPSLTGVYVKGLENSLISKEIFIVIDTLSKINLLIEREKSGFINNNNGYISLRNSNQELLFNEQVLNNRFKVDASLKIFGSSEKNLILKNNKISTTWNCTESKFNEFYQFARNECQADWLCDIACSINPCFIAYVAFAVGKCAGYIK